MFDALVYPLLAVDALILSLALFGLRLNPAGLLGEVARPWISYWWVWLALFGLLVVVDWLVVRAVWRRASKSADEEQLASPPSPALPSQAGVPE